MKLVAFSDTHGSHEDLEVPDGDILIFAGDMCACSTLDDIKRFGDWMSGLPHKHKIAIAGNHDWPFVRDLNIAMRHLGDVIYLEDETIDIDGISIYGSPWTPEFLDWAFMKKRGDEIKAVWDKIPKGTTVLVTHGPPLGMLDSNGREHCGCYDLKMAVERVKCRFHFFGHLHGNYGKESNQDTVFANVSMLDDNYGLDDREPLTFDI